MLARALELQNQYKGNIHLNGENGWIKVEGPRNPVSQRVCNDDLHWAAKCIGYGIKSR